MARGDQPCCGFPIHHWAIAASIINGAYFLVLTLCAGLARHRVDSLEEASTAEGNEEGVWNNAKMVSLSLSVWFAFLAILSFAFAFLIVHDRDPQGKLLKRVWVLCIASNVFVLAWCLGGAIMSFSSVAEEIQAACKTIDTQCYPSYNALKWWSIPMEVIGFLSAAWMLTAIQLFRNAAEDDQAPKTSSNGTEKSSRYPKPLDDEESAPLTSNAAPAATSSLSLGRSRSSKHAPSRKSSKRTSSRGRAESEYSISKSSRPASRSRRYSDRSASDQDRRRASSRGRSASRSRDQARRYEREAEEQALRSLSHSRRSSYGGGGGGRSRSRSRRGSYEEERSIGTRRSSGRRSTSRSRRRDSESDSESSDGGRRRRKSSSRTRSRR